MEIETFENVWDAIETDPIIIATRKLQCELMDMIIDWIKANNLTQTEAAVKLGVTQPRISDLVRGKLHLFGLSALIEMAFKAGIGLSFEHMKQKAA